MTDLVKRLRGRPAPGDHCSKLIAEAANEIERLRAGLKDAIYHLRLGGYLRCVNELEELLGKSEIEP